MQVVERWLDHADTPNSLGIPWLADGIYLPECVMAQSSRVQRLGILSLAALPECLAREVI
jgi:hypothetical protein